jgi:hypothetical protein
VKQPKLAWVDDDSVRSEFTANSGDREFGFERHVKLAFRISEGSPRPMKNSK